MKIYISKILDLPYLPILYPNLGFQTKGGFLFLNKGQNFFDKTFFDLVFEPEEADFLMLPHNYPLIKNQENYLKEIIDLSKKLQKKIIVFVYGDSDGEVNIENSVVFRTSQYKFKKKFNEIIAPPFIEDLLENTNISLREKKEKPRVGFCGFADIRGWKGKLKFWIKTFFASREVYRQGIFFRKKAIKVLEKSNLVKTNFILRDFYSGNLKTIKILPEIARNEYINNLLNSDFVLAPKGDGNFSLRFFEALSLGRIPVLIDTECILPLEEVANYDDFVLRIDYKNISNLDKIIFDFYDKLSDKDWENMQKMARESFVNYLNVKSFYQLFFSDNGFLMKNYLNL
ncbi:MAG: exostosin family protein [Patescibacteria group bacterium]